MYGFLDESGAPGVAANSNDFLVVSLVVFPDRESIEKCSAAIDRLRGRLNKPEGYEFHCSRNSTRPQEGFIKLIPNLDFQFITIAIRKNGWRLHASYPKMAEYLIREIATRFPNIRIEMDANPVLYAELRRQTKKQKLAMKYKQVKSTNHSLIQLADYVVALSTRKLKGTPKAIEQYRPIIKKQVYSGEVTD
ncbi:MAG: DUF3800 domain-containing protein [Candidatus Nomurabacteria bacterium]|jgi:hypothetical protein|nr:DUF3800 domain-containing protein [Candidatus Nomurabacteria bacterium]